MPREIPSAGWPNNDGSHPDTATGRNEEGGNVGKGRETGMADPEMAPEIAKEDPEIGMGDQGPEGGNSPAIGIEGDFVN